MVENPMIREQLGVAATLFGSSDEGIFVQSPWGELWIDDYVRGQNDASVTQRANIFGNYSRKIGWFFWGAETAMQKLEWQHEQVSQGKMSRELWYTFASSDINQFNIYLQSAYDHLADALEFIVSAKKKQNLGSFNDLKKKIDRLEHVPEPLREGIRSADCFDDLRKLRNSVVHFGKKIIVLDPDIGILFSYELPKDCTLKSQMFMYSGTAVDFRRYAGVQLGYFLGLSHLMAQVAREIFGVDRNSLELSDFHGGHVYLKKYITTLLHGESN